MYISEMEERHITGTINTINAMLELWHVGGVNNNIPVLKRYLEYLKRLLTQKAAGQRENEPNDILLEEFWIIVTVICAESMVLYLSGDLERLSSSTNSLDEKIAAVLEQLTDNDKGQVLGFAKQLISERKWQECRAAGRKTKN